MVCKDLGTWQTFLLMTFHTLEMINSQLSSETTCFWFENVRRNDVIEYGVMYNYAVHQAFNSDGWEGGQEHTAMYHVSYANGTLANTEGEVWMMFNLMIHWSCLTHSQYCSYNTGDVRQ